MLWCHNEDMSSRNNVAMTLLCYFFFDVVEMQRMLSMSEDENLLKTTLEGLQSSSKGQLRQDFILHGKTPEEQIVSW